MKLDIPPGEFDAYIFDLDGTLIDTMPLHYRAWDAVMRKAGLKAPLDEELFYSLRGVPTRRVAELLGAHYGIIVDAESVHAKEAVFTDIQKDAKLIAPTVAFAQEAAKTHPMAVASGGPRDIVRRSLALAGLAPLFKVVVTSDDVTHGKPAPDIFLLAARLLGAQPSRCLVFEDATPGFQAAAAAGMQVVRVPSRKPKTTP